ncbi:hypothetical protein IW262DRAFT_420685 [Armillaria fumosa]|nr:hypothetical protein IW262DRAFT_420685 [Armillaria fumosa]
MTEPGTGVIEFGLVWHWLCLTLTLISLRASRCTADLLALLCPCLGPPLWLLVPLDLGGSAEPLPRRYLKSITSIPGILDLTLQYKKPIFSCLSTLGSFHPHFRPAPFNQCSPARLVCRGQPPRSATLLPCSLVARPHRTSQR